MLSDRTIRRLRDIIDDAARIGSFIEDMTLAEFVANERTLFAVERLLQRITEAAIQIDRKDIEFVEPRLPFAQLRGLGNRLRHEYRDVDRGVVFEIARIEVPALAASAELILESYATDDR
jgi:uncharacterized protein with HEPN domain